jgi:hypothetical protein
MQAHGTPNLRTRWIPVWGYTPRPLWTRDPLKGVWVLHPASTLWRYISCPCVESIGLRFHGWPSRISNFEDRISNFEDQPLWCAVTYSNFSTKVFVRAINNVRTHLGGADYSPRRLRFTPRLINVGFVVDGVELRLYRYITLLNGTHLRRRNSMSAFRLYFHSTLTRTLHSSFVRLCYQGGGVCRP